MTAAPLTGYRPRVPAGDRRKAAVVAGLDPAIHREKVLLSKRMDTRVKPAYDVNLLGVRT
jgi:hypothetical protein